MNHQVAFKSGRSHINGNEGFRSFAKGWHRQTHGVDPEPVSEKRTGLGRKGRDKTMKPNKTEMNAAATPGKRTRKHYAEAFKTEAVAHCERHGGDIHRTAVDLGINPWTLRDWVQEHRRRRRPPSPPLDAAGLEAENARLRTELARVTEQRDILKNPWASSRIHERPPRPDPAAGPRARRARALPAARRHPQRPLRLAGPADRGASPGGCPARTGDTRRLPGQPPHLRPRAPDPRTQEPGPRLRRTPRRPAHAGTPPPSPAAAPVPRRHHRQPARRPDHAQPPGRSRATGPARHRLWATDFTFIPTGEGWLHLSVILDLHSRRVVGWAFGQRLDTALALEALQMALRVRRPAAGLVHHSDRGVQYASAAYRAALETHGLVASMSRTANPYDNAAMESFYSTLKTEAVPAAGFATRAQARAVLFDFIEVFYNRRRLHSALGFQPPVDFETNLN